FPLSSPSFPPSPPRRRPRRWPRRRPMAADGGAAAAVSGPRARGRRLIAAAGAAAQRLHSAETATEIAKLLRGLSALDWGGGVLGDPEVYDAFQQLYDQVGHVAKRSALASRTAEQLRGRWLSLVDEVSELEGRPACLLGGG
ncbi:unnamed protein product, partial [Prorocentrum cordatum]